MESKRGAVSDSSTQTVAEHFFSDLGVSDAKQSPIQTDLVKALHYDLVRTKANGCNITEASRRTGIKFATLHDELKFWEFAGLVKLKEILVDNHTEKIIECLPLEKKEVSDD